MPSTMNLWLAIQIGIILFFIFVPIAVILFFIWLKRLFDENRDLQRKELEVWSGENTRFGVCPVCNEQIRSGFQFCPVCHKKLANRCKSCRRFLEIRWTKCPYCGEDHGYHEETEPQQQSLLKE